MITMLFRCGGCDATAEGTGRLEKGASAQGIAPQGWVAFDPYTSCTYCPECWAEIVSIPERHRSDDWRAA